MITRLLISLNVAKTKRIFWLTEGSEQDTETIAACSQTKLFINLVPQKDKVNKKYVNVKEQTILQEYDVATNKEHSFWDIATM